MIRVRCPICERPMEGASRADWPDFPFCSRRCKTIDLGRWLSEEYRLPAEDSSDHVEDDRRTDDDIP